MTRKKRLSDVLRQETQQPLSADAAEDSPLVPLQLPTTAPTSSPSPTPPIDLLAKVEELQKSLETSQESEKKLQKQLKEAQTRLKEQTELNQTLTADRGKIAELTKDLEAAKATILQLVEGKKEQTTSTFPPTSLPRYPVKPSAPPVRSRTTDVGWMD
jgi:predicted transcriptional regulator